MNSEFQIFLVFVQTVGDLTILEDAILNECFEKMPIDQNFTKNENLKQPTILLNAKNKNPVCFHSISLEHEPEKI